MPDFKVPLNIFINQVERDGFKRLPLNKNCFAAYILLPFVSKHTDLFDRFLITIAIQENISVITADEN